MCRRFDEPGFDKYATRGPGRSGKPACRMVAQAHEREAPFARRKRLFRRASVTCHAPISNPRATTLDRRNRRDRIRPRSAPDAAHRVRGIWLARGTPFAIHDSTQRSRAYTAVPIGVRSRPRVKNAIWRSSGGARPPSLRDGSTPRPKLLSRLATAAAQRPDSPAPRDQLEINRESPQRGVRCNR